MMNSSSSYTTTY